MLSCIETAAGHLGEVMSGVGTGTELGVACDWTHICQVATPVGLLSLKASGNCEVFSRDTI